MIDFLFWLAMKLPCRVISEAGEPYLERYFVAEFFGRRYYLHRFVASDPDRGYHDHPWRSAWSVLLAGWYYEARLTLEADGQDHHTLRRVTWLNLLTSKTRHRVLLGDTIPEAPDEAWSLFSHTTPDVKPWGFYRRRLSRGRGVTDFTMYDYSGKQKNVHWERTAPKGRDVRRDVAGFALPEEDMYA